METTENLTPEEQEEKRIDEETLKGTLFSSLVFVGGGIIAFILLLFIIYMVRL